MLCIIYKFSVLNGEQYRFESAWAEVTKAFIEHCGALDSRLHKHCDCEYIAYAQWPSKDVRNAALLPAEIQSGSQAAMRSCCESPEVLFELTPVHDYLVHKYISAG